MLAFMKRYSGFFLLAMGILGLVVMNIVSISAEPESLPIVTTTQGETVTTNSGFVFVDIKGAVKYPEVYMVASSARINDVIAMAGGLLANADLTEVNLAKMVYDQMIIFIPSFYSEPTIEISQKIMCIDIKGEVKYPGVYEVPSTFRIYDVVLRAGGLTNNADATSLNLSQIVTDQMVIVIPSLPVIPSDEIVENPRIYIQILGAVVKPGLYYVDSHLLIKDVINLAGGIKVDADLSKIDLNQSIVNQMKITIPLIGSTSTLPDDEDDPVSPVDDRININTATLDMLDTLPGIGYILAQRIIDYRAEFGPFEAIEDIMNVSGIKESVYEQIKNNIKV